MTEVSLSTQHWWEFGQTIAWVHLDTVISSTTSVGRLEGSVECWAVEGDKFVEPVSNTFEGAATSIDYSVGESGNIAFGIGLADHLLGNFDDPIEDIANGTSELAGRCVLGPWRGLNVCLYRNSHAECECDQ